MGVYQSATVPEVRVRTAKQIISGNIIDSMGKRAVVRMLRKEGRIPSRVEPEERLVFGGWEFTFRWYEVETFN